MAWAAVMSMQPLADILKWHDGCLLPAAGAMANSTYHVKAPEERSSNLEQVKAAVLALQLW